MAQLLDRNNYVTLNFANLFRVLDADADSSGSFDTQARKSNCRERFQGYLGVFEFNFNLISSQICAIYYRSRLQQMLFSSQNAFAALFCVTSTFVFDTSLFISAVRLLCCDEVMKTRERSEQ